MPLQQPLKQLSITETWLTGDARDDRALADIGTTLPSHQFLHSPRTDRHGGGIGVCLHRSFNVREEKCETPESFEYMNLLLSGKKLLKPLRLVVVYRPQRKRDGIGMQRA